MADLLAPILSSFTNYAMTGDGIPEINALTYAPFEGLYASPAPEQRLSLVLIEPRLLDPNGDPELRTQWLARLRRFKGDLRAEGLSSRFILANLYSGPVHKDGRIVLALRRFLQSVRASFPKLEGVILVGNFPEATLVRRVSWCPGFINPRQLSIWPEMISTRAEIVLGDLTGNWESLYRQADFDAEAIDAKPDAATTAAGWFDGESVRNVDFTSTDFTVRRSGLFRDAFYLDDALYAILERRDAPSDPFLRVRLQQAERNAEVDVSDRGQVNVIARPDIVVSRLNASRIAYNPDPALHGTGGETFLDAAGQPQVVPSAAALFNQGLEHIELFNHHDIDLERRLMVDYFDRNHRLRTGAFVHLPFRAGVISGTTDFNPDYYEGLVNGAATDFGACVKVPTANLQHYVQFHKTPAILKFIVAHSNAHYSAFMDGADPSALRTEVGGDPLRWIHDGARYNPTFAGIGGAADIYTHRALWHYGALRHAGASFIIHGGCNVNDVDHTDSQTYGAADYSRWNNAEGLLWYTNCVAIFSRAKGFNDAPWGFTDGFRTSDRANFGSCWKSYYNAQSNDGGLTTYNIQRKRAYFWSLNGDWSLRLRHRNGLGLMTQAPALTSEVVHPNRAWIDGWNFDAALNSIRGIGDVDGDGVDEMVVTSDWGIGLLKHNGFHFQALLTAPRDTWFGGWRYDATINPGRDRVKAVEQFTGSSKKEIALWSSWGISTLEFSGSSLYPSRIHANGTRLGGWLLNTADNTWAGCGHFDSDNRKDVVLTSPWGLGVISLQAGTSLCMAVNGTRMGGWLLNTADNQIRLVGDFDGDGRDEILISSPWGVGVLKLDGGVMRSVAMHPNGDDLGGYRIRHSHQFPMAQAFASGAARQILAVDESGIHVLALSGGRLVRRATVANGTRIDGWVVDSARNRFFPAGDLDGDGRAQMLVRSPWGWGVMGLDATGQIRCHSLHAFGSTLGDWQLETGDMLAGFGRLMPGHTQDKVILLKP